MLAYIVMMTPRLLELRRVLKGTGSLYLHCDPTASHYLKVMLDAIFGPTNFRNEIVWKRTSAHNDSKRFGRVHDVILCYAKSDKATVDVPRKPLDPEYVAKVYTQVDANGRRFRLDNISAPGGRGPIYEWGGKTQPWRFTKEKMEALYAEGRIHLYPDGRAKINAYVRYLDENEGVPVQDWWDDIGVIPAPSKERLGYPTQKPLALLERIIAASSNVGDVVLDPFCGCGTAIDAAQKLGRRWIGIDVTELAIDVIRERLTKQFGQIDYVLGAEPGTIDEAEALARIDKHAFQIWACKKAGVKRPDRKKGADRGIDGEFAGTFDDGSAWRALVSVKGGGVTVNQVRDLIGTMTREGADIGVFVTLKKPTKPMLRDAADAGFTDTGQACVQILTVEELFAGKRPDLPAKAARAPKIERRLRAV
jgi:DNA modification methylase